MSVQRVQYYTARLISPLAIALLKFHTVLTGTQRSRIIVINEAGELLLVRGFVGVSWSLPGGGIEKGESPMAAVQRELYEETGIQINQNNIVGVGILEGEQSPVNYTAHIFTATILRSDLPVMPHNSREIIDIGWFDMTRLPDDLSTIVRPSLVLLSK